MKRTVQDIENTKFQIWLDKIHCKDFNARYTTTHECDNYYFIVNGSFNENEQENESTEDNLLAFIRKNLEYEARNKENK